MTKTESIASIYNRYVDDLFTYALYLGFEKETVMDAIHDVFCKLASDNRSLSEISNIKFYLFRSLKNRLYDLYKTTRQHIELSSTEEHRETPFHIRVTIEDDLIDEEEQRQIEQQITEMLNSLTARQREIVYLRYVQGYDYSQIADLLNISVHGCRKLLSKAMQNLRKRYGALVFLFLLS